MKKRVAVIGAGPSGLAVLRAFQTAKANGDEIPEICLLYTSPSPRDMRRSRMPSSA